MAVDFANLYDYTTSMDDFSQRSRFISTEQKVLPEADLNRLRPLDNEAAQFLWNYIHNSKLYPQYFRTFDKIDIQAGREEQTRHWLYRRGIPNGEDVFLSWEPADAMIVPWELFIKYFDIFYSNDDLTIIDHSLSWSLLFYHEGEIYFGVNEHYEPNEQLTGYWFVW